MTNKEIFENLVKSYPNLVYREENLALFHGDYKLFLTLTPDKVFKQIPTDPPFGINYKSGQRKVNKLEKIANDHEFHCDIDELLRVTRDDGSLWLFYSWKVFLHDERIKNRIVWDKGGGKDISGMGDLESDLANVYEDIAFIPKSDFKPFWSKRPDNIIRDIPKVGSKRIHVNQKPIRLMDRLIKWGSQPGDIILEPFAGSGSTGKACRLNGRYCIMFEKLETNCKIMKNGFSQHEFDFTAPVQADAVESGEQTSITFEDEETEPQQIECYDGTTITGNAEGRQE